MPERQSGPSVASASSDQELFGLLRIGRLSVAVPAIVIREVAPCPDDLLPFPGLIPQIVGAIELRQQVIPVLDLAGILNPGEDGAASRDRIVVVLRMRHADRVFGILANGIDGVSPLDATTTAKLDFAQVELGRAIIRATFADGGLNGVIIDPDALANFPGLASVEDRTSRPKGQLRTSIPRLVFQVGGLRCALDTTYVDASLPSQKLEPAPVKDRLWMAMLQHNGVEIPVIDTLALLGRGEMASGRTHGGAIVLRSNLSAPGGEPGFGHVALLIDSVDDIIRIEADLIAPLDEDLADAPFIEGIIDLASGPCLLLAARNMVCDERIVKLGAVKQKPGELAAAGQSGTGGATAGAEAGNPAGVTETFMVFSVQGCDFATPLGDIDEILSGDHAVVGFDDPAADVVGLLSRRGRTIPVIDFGSQMGLPPDAARAFTIIARGEAQGKTRRAAFRVDALRSVERAVPQRLNGRSVSGQSGNPALRRLDLTIRLGSGQACSVVDLMQIAQRTS